MAIDEDPGRTIDEDPGRTIDEETGRMTEQHGRRSSAMSRLTRHLKAKVAANKGLKDFTSLCLTVSIGGSLFNAIMSQGYGSEGPLMIVAQIATIGGLLCCASSLIRWRRRTRLTHILAKFGDALIVNAVSIMLFRHLPGVYPWIALIVVGCISIMGILLA